MLSNKPHTSLLQKKLQENSFLILAHRGVSQGNIVGNTVFAMKVVF